MKEKQMLENKIETRFKKIGLGLLKRKLKQIGFKRIKVESFDISDYLVLNYGERK